MSKITADVKWLVDQQHQLQSAKEAAETLGRCMSTLIPSLVVSTVCVFLMWCAVADRNPAGNSGDERESKSPEDGGRKKKYYEHALSYSLQSCAHCGCVSATDRLLNAHTALVKRSCSRMLMFQRELVCSS